MTQKQTNLSSCGNGLCKLTMVLLWLEPFYNVQSAPDVKGQRQTYRNKQTKRQFVLEEKISCSVWTLDRIEKNFPLKFLCFVLCKQFVVQCKRR